MGSSGVRKHQYQQRYKRILSAALTLFCEKGIEETSIEDIAGKAEVGPATVYRYFETKAEVAIQDGILYWREVSEKYLVHLSKQKYLESNGRDQIRKIMDIFVWIFEQEFDFLKFLQELDVFVRKYQISQERLKEYEQEILNLKPYVTDALEKGIKDGSLYLTQPVEKVYFSVTHAMLSLMQKLASNGSMLSSDERVELITQIKIVSEIMIRGLQA